MTANALGTFVIRATQVVKSVKLIQWTKKRTICQTVQWQQVLNVHVCVKSYLGRKICRTNPTNKEKNDFTGKCTGHICVKNAITYSNATLFFLFSPGPFTTSWQNNKLLIVSLSGRSRTTSPPTRIQTCIHTHTMKTKWKTIIKASTWTAVIQSFYHTHTHTHTHTQETTTLYQQFTHLVMWAGLA